jgi:hypothetical protein
MQNCMAEGREGLLVGGEAEWLAGMMVWAGYVEVRMPKGMSRHTMLAGEASFVRRELEVTGVGRRPKAAGGR